MKGRTQYWQFHVFKYNYFFRSVPSKKYKKLLCSTFACTGCPTKHDNSKTTWKSSLMFKFIFDFYSSIYFNMYDSWNNYHITLLALAFPKSGLRFLCFQYYRRYKEFGSDFNFVKKQNCRNLNKFFISRAILKAQKRQTTFWKWQDKGNFVIIISRNLLLKLGWQINAANYIKNQDDIQVVLHTVMFRGTPCISWCHVKKLYLKNTLLTWHHGKAVWSIYISLRVQF